MAEYNDNTFNPQANPEAEGSTMRIQDLVTLCLRHWSWFVVSIIICMGLGVAYILRTPPVYTRSASVLIKEDGKGKSGISADVSAFSDMGLFSSKSNVNNELISMQSPAVILEVVRRLNLDKNYSVPGTFHRKTIYGETLPVQAKFIDANDNEGCSFTLDLDRKAGKVEMSDFTLNGEKIEGSVTGALKDTIKTPVGMVQITPTTYYSQPQNEEVDRIFVSRSSIQAAIEKVQAGLTASIADKEATVISLTYNDVNTRRAEEIINTLISVYNENWVRDKNMLATSTSKFINERLGVIESELGNVDSDISSYKSANLIPDLQATTAMYLNQSQDASKAVLELNNQLYMARYIRDFITSGANNFQLLPANSGIDAGNVESQIAEYNNMLLQRNSLLANSSLNNPLVQDMDANLGSMRNAIVTSIDNEINSINAQIRSYRGAESQSTSRLQSNPTQAQYLLSVERQQKVKEALYLFLLQKREENELSQAFTAYNTRIITPPMGKNVPTAPVRRNILLMSFLAGILIPVGLIFLQENLNTRIRGRKDLEKLTVPFIGEIPFAGHRRRGLFAKFKKRQSRATGAQDERLILVKEGSRNMINEAFRVVRGNVEFMLGSGNGSKIVMVASVNAGSGKTFVLTNLAASFAIKGLKVCALDLDLRKATLSKLVGNPTQGVADFLAGRTGDWRKLTVPSEDTKNLDIIPVGTLPPNPAELLYQPTLQKLIEDLRATYDIVFIDCPPVDIVADTAIIAPMADLTIFLVRAGMLDRDMLPVVEGYYKSKKFHNMSLLLNGTLAEHGRYGYHRYGYQYGYGGSYGGYTDEKE